MHDARVTAGRACVAARRAWAVIAAGALVVALGACGDDSSGAPDRETNETVGAGTAADLLGPEDPASGEPVKIGQLTEGTSATVDASDEVPAGQATVEYLNAHRGASADAPSSWSRVR